MLEFSGLVASRKAWLTDVLMPWCREASLSSLKQAELDWIDIAGKVPPEKTLWLWAWSRFPELVHESLGIEETTEVQVTLLDHRTIRGFPDSRASQHGFLVLWGAEEATVELQELGPFSIDQIAAVRHIG